MIFGYEFESDRLRQLVENKAEELGISVDKLIWNYINRGLMDDNLTDDIFKEVHSEEFLKMVDEALGLD